MYPFGSGMQRPQMPNNNNKQSIPFGAGWAIPPQQQQTPYPSASPYPSSTPYPSANQQPAPYPTGNPYPSPAGSSYPGVVQYPSGNSYPSSSPYPSQSNYPAPNPGSSYPNSNSQYSGLPNQSYPQSGGHGYPQSGGHGYPQTGGHGYPPSSANNSESYPNRQAYTQQNTQNPQSGMAQCINEMRFGSSKAKGRPSVAPAPNFDPVADAQALRKAMKGFGTDEDALINVICRRTNEQRQEIQRQYKTHFGKDLMEDIKSETSGNFEKLLVGLLKPIVDFYCSELSDAMAGIGTDEDVLIEILCTLSNSEIHTIKNAYLRNYGAHLESELKSETSGNFKRLLVSLCCANRDESGRVDPSTASNDARELLNAGELRVGTDESMFNMVLCHRNYQQLKLILDEYEKITGHTLEKAIKREFSGDIQEGLLAICKCVTNKAEYFASRLHKSMAGIGTNDKQLIRVIVTRSEIDLLDIKDAFEKIFGKSLKSWIKGDTSGHYKHALYALIGEQRSS